MALICFVIFISVISGVFCDSYYLDDDETIINIYILYLIGFLMLLMLFIIIYLCHVLYKRKKRFIYENQPTLNIEQQRCDGSTQTLCSGITEIKELNEPTAAVCIQNKSPNILKKSLGPKMEIIPKQQMDKIITEVLSRKQRSESGTFRDLIALTKRKSTDGVNKILFNKKLNKIDTKINVQPEEDLYGNSPVKDEKAPNFNNGSTNPFPIKKTDKITNLLEGQEDSNDAVPKTTQRLSDPQIAKNPSDKIVEINNTVPDLAIKVDDIYDAVPNSVPAIDDIYDTVPNPIVKGDGMYDTVPKIVVKVSDVYDTVPNIAVKVDEVYDTVPNKVLEVDDLYDTVPNIIVKVDDVYDTLPETVKLDKNNGDNTNIVVTNVNIVPSSSKQEKVHAILDTDTEYSLLVHEGDSTETARYINANDML